ncbi:trans-sulfuration enzyme family protein [Cyclobacterium marinum]|uniref:Cys/Met metabolism pyridoxal-phosphate-dependent protein n=1 Tax=Cyclobacterium marinum (strain ATCC 25205 / DSM 745 / LMG 13164 / NCIMB 1802) TaxID=880070 RepID=G0J257_CYCMS|nr:aminotransferase class I/II-fold pyridoxal phosphate-dependent enzyme [Cyclobacterium marinum]AEL24566.1 Cys/Met metabolism pyridoxal-phosphate-dependent protein [Cyclobacterium marinum DSM 745]
MKIETIAIHGGNVITDTLKPIIQPVTLSTTFEHQEDSMLYTRLENPNRKSLETVMSSLEGGADAAAFASGNAAGNAVFQALPAGTHMIAPDDMYHGMKMLLQTVYNGKLEVQFIDLTDPENLRNAIKPTTGLLWIETPSNPLLKISDIRVLASIAKKNDLKVVCDSTFATPIYQQALELGADIVMHSSTKYISGHSDILGGILVTRVKDDFWQSIKNVQGLAGAVPSPMDSYLLTRSIKTLPYRMKAHAFNAKRVADFLENHPYVEKVYYPGLASHRGFETAKSQMKGFGAMLSFLIKGNANESDHLIGNLKFFSNATSLGGVESLIERRSKVQVGDPGIPDQLIRMSVGIENCEDLIEDVDQAFNATFKP